MSWHTEGLALQNRLIGSRPPRDCWTPAQRFPLCFATSQKHHLPFLEHTNRVDHLLKSTGPHRTLPKAARMSEALRDENLLDDFATQAPPGTSSRNREPTPS